MRFGRTYSRLLVVFDHIACNVVFLSSRIKVWLDQNRRRLRGCLPSIQVRRLRPTRAGDSGVCNPETTVGPETPVITPRRLRTKAVSQIYKGESGWGSTVSCSSSTPDPPLLHHRRLLPKSPPGAPPPPDPPLPPAVPLPQSPGILPPPPGAPWMRV